ncbi:unnamed protein product [Callosobruchus maculatus]|uniref:T-box domain-containing protein n=1 Tax=Callosobruchus maculatus TaxID=64391 RepID=A0A653CHL3_CALMS|nr:unnamed protein product [Callosobruchus maculatus]
MEDNLTMRPCATDFSIAAIMSRHGRARTVRCRDREELQEGQDSPMTPLEKFVETTSPAGGTTLPSTTTVSSPSTPDPDGASSGGRDSPVDVSSTSEPPSSSSGGSRSPGASRNPLLQERCTSEELRNVVCHLETKELWDKFNELGTEMIITKTGR